MVRRCAPRTRATNIRPSPPRMHRPAKAVVCVCVCLGLKSSACQHACAVWGGVNCCTVEVGVVRAALHEGAAADALRGLGAIAQVGSQPAGGPVRTQQNPPPHLLPLRARRLPSPAHPAAPAAACTSPADCRRG